MSQSLVFSLTAALIVQLQSAGTGQSLRNGGLPSLPSANPPYPPAFFFNPVGYASRIICEDRSNRGDGIASITSPAPPDMRFSASGG